MHIFPAIDLKDGECIRLSQGNFNKVTVYGNDPLKMAEEFINAGAKQLHIVDLDGARTGNSKNLSIIDRISRFFPVSIQTGGGVRTMKDVEERLNAGVSRVIIGTAAIKNPEFVEEAVAKYGARIAVGIDAKDGMVAISGWEDITNITARELCDTVKKMGVKTVIYTDISKDGMLEGINIENTKQLIEETGLNVITSGGVSTMQDVKDALEIGSYGLIIGKALYTKAINLKEAIIKYGGNQ